jgi:hypothetical protein
VEEEGNKFSGQEMAGMVDDTNMGGIGTETGCGGLALREQGQECR